MISKSTLTKKLSCYSALASVALLAAENSDGQILYHKFAKPDTIVAPFHKLVSYQLDLNNDGIADYTIQAAKRLVRTYYYAGYYTGQSAFLFGKTLNDQVLLYGRIGSNGAPFFAAAQLPSGTMVHNYPSLYTRYLPESFRLKIWNPGNRLYFFTDTYRWQRGEIAFAGLRIKTSPNHVNYGWIRLQMLTDTDKTKLVIYDYAYQQLPNAPIVTGDTGYFKPQPIAKIMIKDTLDCEQDTEIVKVTNVPDSAYLVWFQDDLFFFGPTLDSTVILRQPGNYYAMVVSGSHSTVTNSINFLLDSVTKPLVIQTGDTLTSTEASVYQWFLNDQPISGSNTREHIFQTAGYYKVMTTDSNGCSSISDSALFYLQPELKITDTALTCETDSVTLSVTNVPKDSTLQWFMNGFSFGNPVTDTFIIAKQKGTYYVVVNIAGDTYAYTNKLKVVFPAATKPIIEMRSNKLVSTPATAYQWYLNSEEITGANSESYIPLVSGYYQVLITDSAGCSSISDSTQVTLTNVNNINTRSGSIYANDKVLYVKLANNDFINGGLSIINSHGKIILSKNISSNDFSINLFDIAAGIYFVKIEKDGKLITQKIILE
jgi:hypothetical protein